jgi:hypothetical protein
VSKKLWALMWMAAAAAWADVAYLLLRVDVGAVVYPLHPLRLLYYVLIVLAPALTFFPVARAMGVRTFGLEATACWAGLLAMLAFVPPDTAGLAGYLGLLACLFGAVASLFLPVGYALGFKLLRLRAHRRDTGRARREAYLAALFVVLSGAMNVGGFYNVLNAVLLALILALVESFALARKPGPEGL